MSMSMSIFSMFQCETQCSMSICRPLVIMINYDSHGHGRPQTFFQGKAKIFQGGGQEPTFCQKTTKKILFFPKKSKNILFLAGLAPLAPPPADAHDHGKTSRKFQHCHTFSARAINMEMGYKAEILLGTNMSDWV